MRKPLSYAAVPLVAAGGFVVGLFLAACMPWREFTASSEQRSGADGLGEAVGAAFGRLPDINSSGR